YFKVLLVLILASCASNVKLSNSKLTNRNYEVKLDSINLFDKSRNRSIPVALYLPKTNEIIENQKVVILSHCYNQNKLGTNKYYSYLTENLASKGYFVISIQNELPTDELLPTKGDLKVLRKPIWERGCENILFTINEFKKTNPELDYKHLILIGHSNGGDITMLFANKYPNLVDKIISLDNRRVEFPKTSQPKIYSLRSSDQIADEGVLPTIEEQEKFKIKIIKLKNTIHNDMTDNATEKQKAEMNKYIMEFLNN
ncbi:alpha/beta hydrolase, partial [Flavobacterium sp.]|uniref:alpha/beta hydrolase n=1 Tax=Flavobacterium sp. TaxID=239 RepID=UPI00260D4DC0